MVSEYPYTYIFWYTKGQKKYKSKRKQIKCDSASRMPVLLPVAASLLVEQVDNILRENLILDEM